MEIESVALCLNGLTEICEEYLGSLSSDKRLQYLRTGINIERRASEGLPYLDAGLEDGTIADEPDAILDALRLVGIVHGLMDCDDVRRKEIHLIKRLYPEFSTGFESVYTDGYNKGELMRLELLQGLPT